MTASVKATLHAFKCHVCSLNLFGTAGTESKQCNQFRRRAWHPSAASTKRAPFIPDDERTAQALGPKSIAFAAMAAKITTFRNLVLAHR